MRGAVLLGLLVLGCRAGGGAQALAPAGDVPAALVTLSEQLVAATHPCVPAPVHALIDHDAFALVIARSTQSSPSEVAMMERAGSLAANKLCAWLAGAARVDRLRFGRRDGALVIVLRAVTPRGNDYYEVRVHQVDGTWRVQDVHAFTSDLWLSAYFVALLEAPIDATTGQVMNEVNRLDHAGRPAEALARLDQLGPAMLANPALQSQRIGLASRISVPAYVAALDERRRVLPAVPAPIPERLTRALLVADHTAALAAVDALERQTGADPVHQARRASILVARRGPGDLERAAALAEEAVTGAPAVRWTHLAKAYVAVAQQDWPGALGALDGLRTLAGVRLTEAELRAVPALAPLVDTPAYAAWHE